MFYRVFRTDFFFPHPHRMEMQRLFCPSRKCTQRIECYFDFLIIIVLSVRNVIFFCAAGQLCNTVQHARKRFLMCLRLNFSRKNKTFRIFFSFVKY